MPMNLFGYVFRILDMARLCDRLTDMRGYKGRACRIVDALTPIGQASSSMFYAPTQRGKKSVEASIKRFAKSGVAWVSR